MKTAGKSLKHYEQQVNDRHMTSQAPAIDDRLLPENARSLPLAWRRVPVSAVETFLSEYGSVQPTMPRLMDEVAAMMPVHPLSEYRYDKDELTYSGHIQFSASYRTVFFSPETGGILDDWIPAGKVLMIKLGLDEPLPGIPGDRRLTRDKVEKCILLSDALPAALEGDPMASRLEVIPEFFGMCCEDHGVIFRLLPEAKIIPMFSLYSSDRRSPDEPPIIVSRMQAMYKGDTGRMVEELGAQLARPLVESLLAGFRAGFAMEMHAQNTLCSLGDNELIDRVYFRDLEGVVFSNKFRGDRGLEPLFKQYDNDELVWDGVSMQRWFNRNLDHDVGRIFDGVLDALLRHRMIDNKHERAAVRSIRNVVRQTIRSAGLTGFNRPGRLLPYSRAPWGNGLRPGHYFSTRFR